MLQLPELIHNELLSTGSELVHRLLIIDLYSYAIDGQIFTMRCYAERDNATVSRLSVCLSVCLSVTFRYDFHTGWNTQKIFSWLISLRRLLRLTPTWAIWFNGNTPKIRLD